MKKTFSIISIIILAAILILFLAFRPDEPAERDSAIYPGGENSIPGEGTEGASEFENQNGNTAPVPSASTTITAKLNQPVSLAGGTGTITEIIEDSRCPIDVQCIQAGTVRIKVKFVYGTLTQNVNLTLNQPYNFAGRSMTLVGVSPEQRSAQPILPGDYVFTLKANL